MTTAEAIELFEYLYWARDRVLDAAAGLTESEFVASETVTNRDLRATLVHELDVQWSWRERLRGVPSGVWGELGELKADDYPSLESVAEHWRRDEAEMRAWLGGMADAELVAPPPNEKPPFPLSYYVLHLVSHGIQQFSEAAVLLTRAGHSPGDIGFLEFADPRDGVRADPG
jgi:uncharacterized damage-inducible protein DinB